MPETFPEKPTLAIDGVTHVMHPGAEFRPGPDLDWLMAPGPAPRRIMLAPHHAKQLLEWATTRSAEPAPPYTMPFGVQAYPDGVVVAWIGDIEQRYNTPNIRGETIQSIRLRRCLSMAEADKWLREELANG